MSDRPVENMRRLALDAIAAATGGAVTRHPGSQYYGTVADKWFELRTRQRDEQEGGWIRYWFGIRDAAWREADDFFVLVCDLDFVLVVPVSDWLPHIDRFSVSGRGTRLQSRQPHIYWRDDVYELREALRDPSPLILDVRPWVNNFDLLG